MMPVELQDSVVCVPAANIMLAGTLWPGPLQQHGVEATPLLPVCWTLSGWVCCARHQQVQLQTRQQVSSQQQCQQCQQAHQGVLLLLAGQCGQAAGPPPPQGTPPLFPTAAQRQQQHHQSARTNVYSSRQMPQASTTALH